MYHSPCIIATILTLYTLNICFVVDGGQNKDITEVTGQHIVRLTNALTENFKWTRVALIIENGTPFIRALQTSKIAFSKRLGKTNYSPYFLQKGSFNNHEFVRETIRKASQDATTIVFLTSLDLTKRCLVTAHGLNLVNGSHSFIAYDVTTLSMIFHQNKPWLWVATEPHDSRLCHMWKHVMLIMVNLPGEVQTWIYRRAEQLYRNLSSPWINNVQKIISKLKVSGEDSLENVVLEKIRAFEILLDKKNQLKYPFAVYRYGNSCHVSEVCRQCIDNELETGYPVMNPVANFIPNQILKGQIKYRIDLKTELDQNCDQIKLPDLQLNLTTKMVGGGLISIFLILISIMIVRHMRKRNKAFLIKLNHRDSVLMIQTEKQYF